MESVRMKQEQANKGSGIEEWHYVSTKQNPSDLQTHGTTPDKLGAFWFHGPNRLQCKDQWPHQPEIHPAD